MSHLEKFDLSKNTQSYRIELFNIMGSFFSGGLKDFSASLSRLFVASGEGVKIGRVSQSLSKREKNIQKNRDIL